MLSVCSNKTLERALHDITVSTFVAETYGQKFSLLGCTVILKADDQSICYRLIKHFNKSNYVRTFCTVLKGSGNKQYRKIEPTNPMLKYPTVNTVKKLLLLGPPTEGSSSNKTII